MNNTRDGKCGRPTCDRLEQNGGLCKHHYRAAMKAAGVDTGMMDPAPAAARLMEFQGLGISIPQISRVTGIKSSTLWKILRRRGECRASTVQKIMAVPITTVPWKVAAGQANVPRIGTTRRLRGLQVIGYTIEDLSARLGISRSVLVKLISEDHGQPLAWAETARKVDRLFRDLQLTNGGNKITAARSLKKGWHAPLDWDEDEIDVPDADPSDASSSSRMADWYEDYLELVDLGLSAQRIAERQGLPLDTLKTRLARKQEREERDNYEMEESA